MEPAQELQFPEQSYSASECARLAGVSTDTLRYYERQRLLPAPPRAANGYRRYPAEALARIRLIRAALAVGFSVDELTQILGAHDRGLAPCQRVRQLAAGKLEALGSRIRELQHLSTALRKTIDDLGPSAGEDAVWRQGGIAGKLGGGWAFCLATVVAAVSSRVATQAQSAAQSAACFKWRARMTDKDTDSPEPARAVLVNRKPKR